MTLMMIQTINSQPACHRKMTTWMMKTTRYSVIEVFWLPNKSIISILNAGVQFYPWYNMMFSFVLIYGNKGIINIEQKKIPNSTKGKRIWCCGILDRVLACWFSASSLEHCGYTRTCMKQQLT